MLPAQQGEQRDRDDCLQGARDSLKTDQTTGQTGNSLVKSMLMGYDQAAEATLTHVDAGTRQIDYAARLRGQDETCASWPASSMAITPSSVMVSRWCNRMAAIRSPRAWPSSAACVIELKQLEVIHPGTLPIGVWVDVHPVRFAAL